MVQQASRAQLDNRVIMVRLVPWELQEPLETRDSPAVTVLTDSLEQ